MWVGCFAKTFNGWLPSNVFAGWLCPTCVMRTWVTSWIDVILVWYCYIVICTLVIIFNWWLSSKNMKLRVLIKEVLVVFQWLTFRIIYIYIYIYLENKEIRITTKYNTTKRALSKKMGTFTFLGVVLEMKTILSLHLKRSSSVEWVDVFPRLMLLLLYNCWYVCKSGAVFSYFNLKII